MSSSEYQKKQKKPGIIRRTLRGLWRFITTLRRIFLNVLFVLFVAVIISVIVRSDIPGIPEKGALVINLSGALVEQKSYISPLSRLFGGSAPTIETSLGDITAAINFAAGDKRINTLVLKLDQFAYGGISKIQEVAAAIESFKAAGKHVVAVGDNFTQDQYLLASYADEVYLNPMGAVFLHGYGVFQNYYKSALEKLHISFHVFRVGEYKSAVEPYIRDDMSPATKRDNQAWLSVLWREYIDTVSDNRNIKPEILTSYVEEANAQLDKYAGNAATMAIANGLIDGVKTRDQMNQYLLDKVGAQDDEGYYEGINHRRYLWLRSLEEVEPESEEKVALIVAAGSILDGYHPAGLIGGDSTAELIRRARLDANVRALVLRLDSGGGSAFASELIRQELEILKQTGKPLVVSMGSVAASGAYWIAAGADQIWATPTTITGSIGIFGLFPTFEGTLEKLGIGSDGVGTTSLADAMRLDRPLNPKAGKLVQSHIEYGYEKFIAIVAKGRGLTKPEVQALAGGRIWSGNDALRVGLVDHIGGVTQAIESAATLAALQNYAIEPIELPMSPQDQFINELIGESSRVRRLSSTQPIIDSFSRWLAPLQAPLQQLSRMNDPQGVYLHCMSCIAP